MILKMRPIFQEKFDKKMKEHPDMHCPKCSMDDFSPNIEAFEISGEIMCDDCAVEIFEENSQFGMGA